MSSITVLKVRNGVIPTGPGFTSPPEREPMDQSDDEPDLLDVEMLARLRTLIETLIEGLGRKVTAAEEILIRRIAVITVQLEEIESGWSYTGTASLIALEKYAKIGEGLCLLKDELRKETTRTPTPIRPTPMDIHRNNRP